MNKEIIRILCFSDTHGFHHALTNLLRPADIILCGGDFTNTGTISEFNSFINWFSNLEQFQYKIFCCGNHEIGFQKNYNLYKSLIPDNVIFLDDSAIEIEGLRFYGTPWTKEFYDWAWMYKEHEAKTIWNKVPLDTQILLHHQPAYAIRDYVERLKPGEIDSHVGCKVLGEKIDQLDNLLLSITGHLHSKKNYGASKIGNTMFANVAQLNDHYMNKNRRPLLFEIDKNLNTIDLIN